MNNRILYPDYIPRKWIHLAGHKKKRIRKKYQNRIRRAIYSHPGDLETQAYKLRQIMSGCGHTTSEWCRAAQLATHTLQTMPPIEPNTIEIEKLAATFHSFIDPIVAAVKKVFDKLIKWARDFWDRIWCNNRHWWTMAEHHKKYRIRKKYRNKIKRMARQRAGELLHSLESGDSEDRNEASDDSEEVP